MLCCGPGRAAADLRGNPAVSPVSLHDTAGINEQCQSETMPERQVNFCVHLNRGNPVHRDFRTWWLECRMHGEKVCFCRTFPKASKDSLKPTKPALKPQLQQKRKSP